MVPRVAKGPRAPSRPAYWPRGRRWGNAASIKHTMDEDRIIDLFRAFAREGVRYKVVGGVALNLHGLVRATEDLDIFVDPSASNVEHLKVALRSVFADPEIDRISAADLSGEYPAVQYLPPDGTFSIDILSRLGTAFDFEAIESEETDVEGIVVPVATPRMLYRMKKDTVRLQDRADAERLRRDFNLEDD